MSSRIYHGAGQSTSDSELTAHELTHVVQQDSVASLQKAQLAPRSSRRGMNPTRAFIEYAQQLRFLDTGIAPITADPSVRPVNQRNNGTDPSCAKLCNYRQLKAKARI
jgi:Domain of unknown function (DUF4157)